MNPEYEIILLQTRVKQLEERVGKLQITPEEPNTRRYFFQHRAAELLLAMGCPADTAGFQYLKSCIALAAENPFVTCRATKRLYPQVAEEFGVKQKSMEKALSVAVGLVFEACDEEELHRYFGPSEQYINNKIGTTEFIAAVAEYISMS